MPLEPLVRHGLDNLEVALRDPGFLQTNAPAAATVLTGALTGTAFSAVGTTQDVTNKVAIDIQAGAFTTGTGLSSFTAANVASGFSTASETITGLLAGSKVLLMMHDSAGDSALFVDNVTTLNVIAAADLTLVGTISANTTNTLVLGVDIK